MRKLFLIFFIVFCVMLSFGEVNMFPVQSETGDFIISPDGKSFALVFGSQTNYYVQINDSLMGPIASKTKPYLYIQDNLFVIRYKSTNKLHYMLTEDEQYGPYTDLFDFKNFTVSETGEKFGFSYTLGSRYFIFADEFIYGPYNQTGNYSCVISPDGKTTGMVYEMLNDYYAEFNGNKYGPFDQIWRLSFDNDASRFGLTYISNDYLYGMVDNEIYGPYRDTNEIYYIFSPDGERAARQYLTDEGWWVYAGTNTYGPYGSVWNLQYNADSTRFGFMYVLFNKYYVVVDGEKQGPYDTVVGFDFSPAGSRYAYAYYNNKNWYLRVDEMVYGPFDGINLNRYASYPHLFLAQFESGRGIYDFNSDDSRLGFVYRSDGDTYVRIDDQLYGPFQNASFTFDVNDRAMIGYIQDGYATIGHLQ